MKIRSTILFIGLICSNIINGAPITAEGDPEITHQVIFEIQQGDKLLGNLTIGLFGTVVPRTVTNFYELSSLKFKDTIFHRVIKDFMIQGGDFTNRDGTGGYSIYGESKGSLEDENFDLKHDRAGRLSMANSGDPNSGGSQFFITSKVTSWLDGKHVVFGQLTDGFETFSLIESTKTNANDRPIEDISIIHVYTQKFLQTVESKEIFEDIEDLKKNGSTSIDSSKSNIASEEIEHEVEEEDEVEEEAEEKAEEKAEADKGKKVESIDDELNQQLNSSTESNTSDDDSKTNDTESASKAHYALIPILIFVIIIGFMMLKVKKQILFAVKGPRYRRI